MSASRITLQILQGLSSAFRIASDKLKAGHKGLGMRLGKTNVQYCMTQLHGGGPHGRKSLSLSLGAVFFGTAADPRFTMPPTWDMPGTRLLPMSANTCILCTMELKMDSVLQSLNVWIYR